MKKNLLVLVVLSISACLIAGCDSGGGGKIEPISKPGGAAAKTGGGPHPMPGATQPTAGN